MRNRNIDKHLWLNRSEAQTLQKKSKKACMSESQFLRMIIKGDYLKERPDDRFYKYLNALLDISKALTIIAKNSDKCTGLDADLIMKEVNENSKFRLLMMKEYLNPEEWI